MEANSESEECCQSRCAGCAGAVDQESGRLLSDGRFYPNPYTGNYVDRETGQRLKYEVRDVPYGRGSSFHFTYTPRVDPVLVEIVRRAIEGTDPEVHYTEHGNGD